jgi:carboxymethylenebutenolidase
MDVEFACDGRKTSGHLAVPKAGKGPGVLVLQEWWGLVPHIREVCDRFAEEGFTALAPDLYHGRSTKDPDEAGRMMMGLDVPKLAEDLRGTIDFLRARPECSSQKVGTVGFCLGGQLSLFAASIHPDSVGACVNFYGIHPNVKPDLSRLAAPVLGLFAEKDAYVNAAAVADLARRLDAANRSYEFTTYPDVDHAFFNDTRPEVYDLAAAEDAWKKTVAFLRKNLVPERTPGRP